MILGVAIQYAYADPPVGCSPPTYCGVITATSSKIGIGTTTPASALHVWGDIRIGSSSAGIVFPDGSVQKVAASAGGAVSAANVSTDVFGRFQGNGNFAAPASFGVATSSQNGLPQTLSVYGGGYFSGSVGVGTTTPQGTLDVWGTLFSTNRTNNNNRHIILSGYAGGTWDVYGGHGGGGYFGIAENQGTPFFTILGTSGNVGIGTVSPLVNLDILGAPVANRGNLQILDTTAQAAGVGAQITLGGKFTDAGSITPGVMISAEKHNSITNDYSFDMAFSAYKNLDANMAERMRIDGSTGNIGIGTTTPAEKLQVHGSIKISSSSAGIAFPDNSFQKTGAGVPNGIQVFTAGGTFTVPAGVKKVWVEVQGGGGGGGAGGNGGPTGGGGGAGGYAAELVTGLTPGGTVAVTIGAGGAGGTCSGACVPGVGETGGTSSFGSYVSATGGGGGNLHYYNGTYSTWGNNFMGGAGGTGSNGDINLTGSAGVGNAQQAISGDPCSGSGGPGYRGTGAGRSACLAGLFTEPGSAGGANTGAGGGGGPSGNNGYAGGTGIVVVWW